MPEIIVPDFLKGRISLAADGLTGRTLAPGLRLGGHGELLEIAHLSKDQAKSFADVAAVVDGDPTLPRPEDLFALRGRMLSMALIDGIYDFSAGNILQGSLALLEPMTMFVDHVARVQEWVGKALEYEWEAKSAIRPPGINFSGWVDSIKAPGLVRGMRHKPPTVDRFSVTVLFDFKRSHPDLSTWTFFDFLGEEYEGEIVRLIVTEIKRYYELSVVWYGADPDAEMYSLGLGADRTRGIPPEKREENAMPTLKELAAETPTAKLELEVLTAKAATAEQLTTDKEALATEVLALKPRAALGEKYLQAQKTRANAALGLLNPAGVPEGDVHKRMVEAAFTAGDVEMVDLKVEELEAKVNEKFPLHCSDCKSLSINRRQTESSPADEPPKQSLDDDPNAAVGAHLDGRKEKK